METLNQSLSTGFFRNTSESHLKPYRKPALEELGDLRAITLSGSNLGNDFSGTFTCHDSSADPCPF